MKDLMFKESSGAQTGNGIEGGARAPGAPVLPTPMTHVGHVHCKLRM